MLNKINFGVVGLGHLGKFHIEQALKIKQINFAGIYDINYTVAENMSKKYSVKCFSSLKALCLKCDAVSVVCSTSAHFDVSMLALKMGCHVFIEKPITTSVEQGEKLISCAKSQKLKIQVGHIERFNPAFVAYTKTNPLPLFIESHRISPFNVRGSDVAVILDLMIHDIDLILSLIKDEIIDIQASGISVISDFIDLANARISFKCGATANLTASRISTKQIREMRVFERLRYTKINFNSLAATQNSMNNQEVIQKKLQVSKDNALFLELQSFVSSIINKSKIIVSGNDGLRALKVAIKIQNIIENK